MCQIELRGVRCGLLMLALFAGWIPVHAHLVTFRVHMPDPAMEAVVEVNGEVQNTARWCGALSGPIALQSEGAVIEFRNIRLRPIR